MITKETAITHAMKALCYALGAEHFKEPTAGKQTEAGIASKGLAFFVGHFMGTKTNVRKLAAMAERLLQGEEN